MCGAPGATHTRTLQKKSYPTGQSKSLLALGARLIAQQPPLMPSHLLGQVFLRRAWTLLPRGFRVEGRDGWTRSIPLRSWVVRVHAPRPRATPKCGNPLRVEWFRAVEQRIQTFYRGYPQAGVPVFRVHCTRLGPTDALLNGIKREGTWQKADTHPLVGTALCCWDGGGGGGALCAG